MLAGRGVALGLGGMKLTDLNKRLSTCSSSSAHYYLQHRHHHRQPQPSRRYSSEEKGSGRVNISNGTTRHILLSPPEYSLGQIDAENKIHDRPSATSMEQKPPSRHKKQQQQEEEPKKRVVVRKSINRRTFWAACRAVVFGTLLVFLGVAMCTIGYYRDYFAMENVMLADNVTAMAPNPTKKVQFHSLSFIGPVVMGAGAFVLMIACVTTLESRDRQARIFQQQQAELDAERTPLSRRGTGSKGAAPPSFTGARPSALKSPTIAPIDTRIDTSIRDQVAGGDRANTQKIIDAQKRPLKSEMDNSRSTTYQAAELVTVPSRNGTIAANTAVTSGGVVNRCFTRDDSKTTSKPDTDSGPSGTTTTTLTWSKNGGPRCEADSVSKFPSTSCIDSLIKKPDERALLQRFLEDQSRLVEDRLNRRIKLQQKQQQRDSAVNGDDGFRSVSLDVAGSEKMTRSCSRSFRSEQMAPRENVVAAEVHRASDASPTVQRVATTTIDAGVDYKYSSDHPQVPTTRNAHSTDTTRPSHQSPSADKLRAPIISPDTLESFSPVTATPGTPASLAQKKQQSSFQIPSPLFPPHLPSVPTSPVPTDRSIGSSYVTVIDGGDCGGATIDLFNANLISPRPIQSGCSTVSSSNYFSQPSIESPPANTIPAEASTRKLYDSVFLAETLRQHAAAASGAQQCNAKELASLECAEKDSSVTLRPRGSDYSQKIIEDSDAGNKGSQEQTGELCNDWKELNANYLRNQV